MPVESLEPAAVISEARRWLGTPFHHQGRKRGLGCDCAGLVLGVGQALELLPRDLLVPAYGRVPGGRRLRHFLERHGRRSGLDRARPGDVVLVAWERVPRHLGILGETTQAVIHAHEPLGGVVEQRLDSGFAGHIVAVYRFPGVK